MPITSFAGLYEWGGQCLQCDEQGTLKTLAGVVGLFILGGLIQLSSKSKPDSILNCLLQFTQLGTLWLDQSVHWKWLSWVNLDFMVSFSLHMNFPIISFLYRLRLVGTACV